MSGVARCSCFLVKISIAGTYSLSQLADRSVHWNESATILINNPFFFRQTWQLLYGCSFFIVLICWFSQFSNTVNRIIWRFGLLVRQKNIRDVTLQKQWWASFFLFSFFNNHKDFIKLLIEKIISRQIDNGNNQPFKNPSLFLQCVLLPQWRDGNIFHIEEDFYFERYPLFDQPWLPKPHIYFSWTWRTFLHWNHLCPFVCS